MSDQANREGRDVDAKLMATGLIFDNPCGCTDWLDGTHALYWRIPEDEYHGVSECFYCGATWGLFDHHDNPPPWQMKTVDIGDVKPGEILNLSSVTINVPVPPKPLGPRVDR